MKANLYSIQTFKETLDFKEYGSEVQSILNAFLNILTNYKLDFVVKIRNGANKVITIAYKDKPSTIIATIFIYSEHIRIKVLGSEDVKLSSNDGITSQSDIIIDIVDKYNELTRGKRQFSIYIFSDILNKIETLAGQQGKKPNELIEEYLYEMTVGLFKSVRHKNEFIALLKQADLFKSNLNHNPKSRIPALLSFTYLISAYQKDYLRKEGSKFSFIKKEDTLQIAGPIHLFKEAELGVDDSETMLLLGKWIYFESENQRTLTDILYFINTDTNLYSMYKNALEILSMKYKVDPQSEDVLVEDKMVVDVNSLENITLW